MFQSVYSARVLRSYILLRVRTEQQSLPYVGTVLSLSILYVDCSKGSLIHFLNHSERNANLVYLLQ